MTSAEAIYRGLAGFYIIYDPAEEKRVVAASSLDGVMVTLVLSDTEDKVRALQRAAGLLKKGGWAAVIEW